MTGRYYIESGTAKERVRILKNVERKKDKHSGWWFIYIYWEKDFSNIGGDERFDCGYSGMEENAAKRNNWSIELVEN